MQAPQHCSSQSATEGSERSQAVYANITLIRFLAAILNKTCGVICLLLPWEDRVTWKKGLG